MTKEELKKLLAAKLTTYDWPGLHEAASELAKETQETPEDVELSDLRTISPGYRLEMFQRVKTRRAIPAGWARDLYVALGRSLVAHPGGRPRVAKESRALNISVESGLMDKLDAEAATAGKTKRKIVEEALACYFKRAEKRKS